MEYKYLIKNHDIQRYDLNNSKYKKILDNLLSIKNSDKAIKFQVNKNNIDLVSKLDKKTLEKIYTSSNFKIKITNFDDFEELEKIENNLDLYNYIINNSLTLPKILINKIIDNQDFVKNKEDVLNHLTKNSQNFLVFWKQFKKTIDDDYEQNNIWSLYIGSYFLDLTIYDKHIFAPLIFKSVNITIHDNDVYLESTDNSIILNEKIIYYIENFININFPTINQEEENISFDALETELDEFLKNSIDINNESDFIKINKIDLKNNSKITGINKFSKCLVLSVCNPTGSFLRKVMINLINNDKIDDLLNVDISDVLNAEKNAIENLFKQSKIYHICDTDLSQEKAINAALNNKYSIIIGPPGTGKSQTIANLLCNIIANNKKALFISQKKVALEVVLERLNKLRLFTLSLINNTSNADEKIEFYKYLNDLFDLVKSDNINSFLDSKKEKISNNQINYWNLKDYYYENFKDDLEDYYYLLGQFDNVEILIEFINIIMIGLEINNNPYMNKIWDINFTDEIEIANFLGVNYKKSIFTKKPKFSDEFIEVLNFHKKILNFKNSNPSITKDIYLKLINLNIDKFLRFVKNYKFDLVPKCNSFYSSEQEIISIQSKNILDTLLKIQSNDKKFSSKFFGRIQRSFTLPYKFINLFKNELKKIFNVIVSTPEVLSTFVDFENEKYDYVIFDEASQIFLEKALPYISIGSKVIIAGDNQQMQPSNWLGIRADVDNSEDNEDENIDSLLTYAIAKGLPMYNLELNYRSVHASLTSFSSKEFYESNLKCLNSCNFGDEKAIEVIDVNGTWRDKINFEEAEMMIKLLQELHEKYEKVILLTLNLPQMQLVDYLLSSSFPELYQKVLSRKIIIKNLENIQGDEADLVIVSIAYTKDTHLHSTYVCRPEGRNALNVAITRAKYKLIILKSINSNDVVPTETNQSLSTFKNWLYFLELSENDQINYALVSEEKYFDSDFEKDVYIWLNNLDFMKNYKILTQYKVGSYRIDIAICDINTNKFIFGIEVDGWKYHSSPKQKYSDIIRQDFLEAKGYKILRIPEIMWKIEKTKIIKKMKEILS